MDSIIKISSEQSGEFSATNNVVRFRIPADGQYDLVDSYIVLNMEATGEVSNAGVVTQVPAGGKSNFRFQHGGTSNVEDNVSFKMLIY